MIQPTVVAFQKSVDLFEKWDGRDGGRIRYCFAPRYAPVCTTELLRLTADFSAEHGAHVHTHASESEEEERIIIERTGMREVVYLDSVGLINPRTVLAHCVHLDNREIDIMARRGSHVAHCPSANLYLASGIAPIPRMMERGVNISIGPDGSDNNNLDNILEMRLAALLQKGLHQDPVIPPSAKQSFEFATLGGARALGLEDEIGSIEVGKKADIIMFDELKKENKKFLRLLANEMIEKLDYDEAVNSNRNEIKKLQSEILQKKEMLKRYTKSTEMLQKVQKELKKVIDINDITPELLHKLIHKIEVKENKDIVIHYRFSNPFFVK